MRLLDCMPGEPGLRSLRARMTRAVRTASDRWSNRADEGMSLIECIVAVTLLVIILLPTTLFVIEGERASSQTHLIAEANTLASQALQGLQAEASRNNLPTGFQRVTQSVQEVGTRKTTFTISTDWTTVRQGSNKDICAAGVTGPAQQIWLVQVSVSWQGMGGAQPVTETTEISPGNAGGIQQGAGELAVTLDTQTASGTQIFQAAAVSGTVTGTWNTALGPQPSVPSGQVITATDTSAATSGGQFDGCLVFQDLDVQTGWSYAFSLAGNPSIVQAGEFSDTNPGGAYVQPVTLQAGVPNIITVFVSLGDQVTINYTQGPGGNCTSGTALTAPATTSEIPVTVNNAGLSMYTNQDWIAYNTSGTAFSSVLLYEGYTAITSVWAGSGPTAQQVTPCTINPSSAIAISVFLQLYDLKMTVTGSPTTFTATQLGGSAAVLNLNIGATSQTDLPLGHYVIGDGSGSVTQTSGGAAADIWVTETGECFGNGGAAPSPCNSATLAVTAS